MITSFPLLGWKSEFFLTAENAEERRRERRESEYFLSEVLSASFLCVLCG
jgi:hypothetical protein